MAKGHLDKEERERLRLTALIDAHVKEVEKSKRLIKRMRARLNDLEKTKAKR